jgi:hypothetical protein
MQHAKETEYVRLQSVFNYVTDVILHIFSYVFPYLKIQTTSHISYPFCLPLTEFPASLCVKRHKFCLFLCTFCNVNGGKKQSILGILCMVSCPSQGSDFCRQRRDCSCTLPSIRQCGSIFTFIDIGQQSHISVQVSQLCLIPFTFLSYYAEYEKFICAWRRLLTSILPFLGRFSETLVGKQPISAIFVLGQL